MAEQRNQDTPAEQDAQRAFRADPDKRSAGTTDGGATALNPTEAPSTSGGVAGGMSGETGSASGTSASPNEAAGAIVADERTEPAREDRTADNPVGPGLQPRPDTRGT